MFYYCSNELLKQYVRINSKMDFCIYRTDLSHESGTLSNTLRCFKQTITTCGMRLFLANHK